MGGVTLYKSKPNLAERALAMQLVTKPPLSPTPDIARELMAGVTFSNSVNFVWEKGKSQRC